MRSFARTLAIVGLALLSLTSLTACTRVERGEVGILFNLYGSDKGVADQVVGPGRYWLTPNEELYTYPTTTTTRTWAYEKDVRDERISFQSKEGMVVSADIGVSFHLEKDKIPLIFQKYRKGVDEITDVYIHNHIRDALNELASGMTVEEIYSTRRNELILETTVAVRKELNPLGIRIEKVYTTGALYLPTEIQAAVNAKLKATQMAQQRENEVAQAKAEADKAVEEARGVADSTLLRAKADAEAIRVKAEALRENPKLVELTLAERWDGKLPGTMYGPVTPFVTLSK